MRTNGVTLGCITLGLLTTLLGQNAVAADGSAVSSTDSASTMPASSAQNQPVVENMPEMVIQATTEQPDYVVPDTTTGTKTDTPLMETPFNIQVIPSQVLEEQKATTLDQALTNVSGVISNSFGQGQETLYLRGFQTFTTYLNGFKINDNTSGLRTLTNVSSIDVLKGPAAILYGAIEPGGLVNLTTKQPQATTQYMVEQSFGSWSHSITNLNATGPVNENKTLLYQVNVSYDTQQSWVDQVYDRKTFIAPTIRWNISPATKMTLEMEYTHNPLVFDNAQFLPIVNGQFVLVPRSTYVGPSSLPYTVDTNFTQLRLSHDFSEDWSVKFQMGDHKANAEGFVQSTFFGSGCPSAGGLTQVGSNFLVTSCVQTVNPGLQEDDGVSVDVIGKIATGQTRQKILVGAEHYTMDSQSGGGSGSANSMYSVSLFNPVYSTGVGMDTTDPNYGYYLWEYKYNEDAVYLQDQIELPNRIFGTVGLRYDRLTDSAGMTGFANTGGAFSPLVDLPTTDSAVTPRIGVLWRALDSVSLYGNYAGNLSPNLYSTDYLGHLLGDSHARQYEGGVKYENPNGDFRATLAVYDLYKTNVPTPDTNSSDNAIANALGVYGPQVLLGEVESKGAELDVEGNILPNWHVIFTLAHTATMVTKTDPSTCTPPDPLCVGFRFANVPSDMGSFWTTYDFKGQELQGWKVGLGASGQNSSTSGDNALAYPGFGIVNAMVSYATKTGFGKVTAQLNVNNIFDKYYFTGNYAANYSGGPYSYASVNIGPPLNAIASVRLNF